MDSVHGRFWKTKKAMECNHDHCSYHKTLHDIWVVQTVMCLYLWDESAKQKHAKKVLSRQPSLKCLRIYYPCFASFVLLEEGQIKRGLHMRVWSSLVQREEPRQYEMERKVWVEKWMKGHKGEGIRRGHRCDITLVIGMAGGKCVNIPSWEGLSPSWLAHLSGKISYYLLILL